MAAVARYGGYAHDDDEISTILHEVQPVLSPQGRPFLRRSLIVIRGTVLADDRDGLTLGPDLVDPGSARLKPDREQPIDCCSGHAARA